MDRFLFVGLTCATAVTFSCTKHQTLAPKTEVVLRNMPPLKGTFQIHPKGTLSLANLRGKVVILSFFTTGCWECQALSERFARVQAAFGRDKVAVVMVAFRPQLAILTPFLAAMNFPFPVVIGDKDSLKEAGLGWITTVPTTLILDPEGRPRYGNVRLGSTQLYAQKVRAILSSR